MWQTRQRCTRTLCLRCPPTPQRVATVIYYCAKSHTLAGSLAKRWSLPVTVMPFLSYVAVQAVTVNKLDARCTRHPNPSEGTPVGGLMVAPFTSSHTPWRSAQMHVCACGSDVKGTARSSRQVLCLYIVCEHSHVRIDRLRYTNDSNVANHSNLVIPLCLLLQHNRIIAATTTPQQLRTTTTTTNGHKKSYREYNNNDTFSHNYCST